MVEQSFETSKRLQEIRKKLNRTQKEFAKDLGTMQGHLSQMENSVKEISANALKNLCWKYPNVNINWLLTGHGEMFLPEFAEKIIVQEDENSTLTAPLLKLGEMLQQIEANQKQINQVIESKNEEIRLLKSRLEKLEGGESEKY